MSTQPQEIARRIGASVMHTILHEVQGLLLQARGSIFSQPGATVLTEDTGDIDTLIESAIGTLGLCTTIMLVQARDAKPNLPGPVFGQCQLIIEIAELALTNRSPSGTGVTALEAAEDAARILHQARCPSGRMLLVSELRKFAQPPPPADNCYHLICNTGEIHLARR